MTLIQITKVKGPGIHTQANIVSNTISLGGIATASNFKTGTSNLHNVGVEVAGINVLGADTPIGTGATIYDAGGAIFTGVVTATSFSGTSSLASGLTGTPDVAVRNITGVGATFTGNVSIGGTLTYEDVTNIDSVGIITARDGLKILGGGANVVGVITATGANVTGQTTIAHTGYPQLILKDSDSNSPNDTNGISLRSANNTEYGFIGNESAGGHSLHIKTVNTVNPIRLKVNNTTRLEVGNTGCFVTGVLDVAAGGTTNLRGDTTLHEDVYIPDKIIHIGDTDTAIRFPANDTISFETAGSEAVRITSGGRVGVGTITPHSSYRFDIRHSADTILHLGQGGATLANMANNSWNALSFQGTNAELGLFKDSSGNFSYIMGTYQGGTAIPIVFRTGNRSERMRIHNTGKVTIASGTKAQETSTGLLLLDKDLTAESDVGDPNNYHLVIRSQSNSNTSKLGIGFQNTTDDAKIGAAILHHRTGGGSVGELAFYTSPSDGTTTEAFRISSTGTLRMDQAGTHTNVLANDTGGPNIWLRNTSNTDGNFSKIGFFNSTGYITAFMAAQYQDAGDRNTDLVFGTRKNGGALVEALRIDSNANVGIDKTSGISARLHIGSTNNDGSLSQLIKLGNDSSGTGTGTQINMGAAHGNESTAACIAGFYDGTGTSLIVKTAGTYSNQSTVGERLRITSGGCVYANNFGIGTDNRWKIRGNTSNTDLAFEYSTSSSLSDNNIKAYFQGSSTDARLIFRKTETGSCGLEFRNGTTQKAYQMLDSEENMMYVAQSGVHHRFYTGGSSETFRVGSDGTSIFDVGAPSSSNKVIGRFQSESSRKLDIVWHDSGSLMGFNTPGNHSYIFKCNDVEKLRIESGGNVKLPDNAQIRFGNGPDLSLYHDHANQVNIITANTNLPIKIQGNVHFYNYAASGGFHAKLDGDGLALQNATRPTLPTTGVQPMIHGYATHFYREIHRTISDYRGLCDGSHSGYLLLVQAYGGSGTTAGKKFYGTIMADRGGTGSGNSTNVAYVHATTAYNTDRFNVSKERNTQYFTNAAKVTYSGTDYLALKFGATGGGPDHGIHIDGTYRNVDANFCKIVRTNEVTVVDDNYGSMNNMPAADALLCGFSQRNMSGSTFDSGGGGVMKGGVTVFEHGDCYDASTGVFTAKFNGVYQFGCGILVQTGSGRLEGAIKINDGGGYDALCNFNGTGTTYDGPSAVSMAVMRAGWTARVERLSGNAYDNTHGNSYFWGWMVQAMNKANAPATFY